MEKDVQLRLVHPFLFVCILGGGRVGDPVVDGLAQHQGLAEASGCEVDHEGGPKRIVPNVLAACGIGVDND